MAGIKILISKWNYSFALHVRLKILIQSTHFLNLISLSLSLSSQALSPLFLPLFSSHRDKVVEDKCDGVMDNKEDKPLQPKWTKKMPI